MADLSAVSGPPGGCRETPTCVARLFGDWMEGYSLRGRQPGYAPPQKGDSCAAACEEEERTRFCTHEERPDRGAIS